MHAHVCAHTHTNVYFPLTDMALQSSDCHVFLSVFSEIVPQCALLELLQTRTQFTYTSRLMFW